MHRVESMYVLQTSLVRFVKIQAEGGVRMLCMSTQGLLAGTTMNSILLIRTTDTYTPLQGAKIDDVSLTQVKVIVDAFEVFAPERQRVSLEAPQKFGKSCFFNRYGRSLGMCEKQSSKNVF